MDESQLRGKVFEWNFKSMQDVEKAFLYIYLNIETYDNIQHSRILLDPQKVRNSIFKGLEGYIKGSKSN